mgnify:CR=1 FL=1
MKGQNFLLPAYGRNFTNKAFIKATASGVKRLWIASLDTLQQKWVCRSSFKSGKLSWAWSSSLNISNLTNAAASMIPLR